LLRSGGYVSPCRRRSDTVFLEELTWTEVRDALKAGKTTIILPTGGIEQSGPHLVLGKHNYIVRYASERIARRSATRSSRP
jgi:creatinine amidohydrolase/Fe(II)-dependent formamide hydrolase-like protein